MGARREDIGRQDRLNLERSLLAQGAAAGIAATQAHAGALVNEACAKRE